MGKLRDLATAVDPALILQAAGMMADPWQEQALRSRPRQLLLNCSRQSGKTAVAAAMAVDEALNKAPALVLVLSPSLRQSQEGFRAIMQIHQRLGGSVAPDQESSLRVELPNGSRIIALPGKEATVRGYSAVALLLIDEAARVPDDLYHALRPMLAVSGGRLSLMSTPFGRRGFFYREWAEGKGWEKVKITAEQCPRIPASFLEQERRSLPEAWFQQEYFCEFMEPDSAFFSYADVMGALTEDVKPLFELPAGAVSADVAPLFVM